MLSAATTLEAALQLRARGYAPHWLRPRSKVPIDREWSVAPVMSAEALRASYQLTYNVGIRCGLYSTPMPDLGLVVIDTDVKVAAYAPEAHMVLGELLAGNTTVLPYGPVVGMVVAMIGAHVRWIGYRLRPRLSCARHTTHGFPLARTDQNLCGILRFSLLENRRSARRRFIPSPATAISG